LRFRSRTPLSPLPRFCIFCATCGSTAAPRIRWRRCAHATPSPPQFFGSLQFLTASSTTLLPPYHHSSPSKDLQDAMVAVVGAAPVRTTPSPTTSPSQHAFTTACTTAPVCSLHCPRTDAAVRVRTPPLPHHRAFQHAGAALGSLPVPRLRSATATPTSLPDLRFGFPPRGPGCYRAFWIHFLLLHSTYSLRWRGSAFGFVTISCHAASFTTTLPCGSLLRFWFLWVWT